MSLGTSIVSTATRQAAALSTRAGFFAPAAPTFLSNAPLLQPRGGVANCCVNKVIINLSTAVVIPDYSRYYKTPIESFSPSFLPLTDGSLVTPPFIQDLLAANLNLLVDGMLAMLFIRNLVVSADYIRRGKVKKKTLFYVLLLSQLLAPVSLVPLIWSYFNQRLNCTLAIILSYIAGTISLALLITGILGVKAYKCLDNSRFVLVVLILFQCASSGVVAADVAGTRGERRLSGSCVRVTNMRLTRIFVMLQFFESLFLCLCFMYACRKSRGSAVARGRISLQLSMEDISIDIPDQPDPVQNHHNRRGWWDYVPDVEKTPALLSARRQPPLTLRTLFADLILSFKRTVAPLQTLEKAEPRREKLPSVVGRRGSGSPTPSSFSRFIPRVELFQKVMKDELLYTTFITANCVVVAVLLLIGVNFNNGLTVSGWIALNWSIISVLAIHSFGRVVHRHELEAILQDPGFIRNPPIGIANSHYQQNSRSIVVAETRRSFSIARHRDHDEDPFSDTRRLGSSRASWNTDRSSRLEAILSACSPPLDEDAGQVVVPVTPSMYAFPVSGRTTPVVPHRGAEEALHGAFSQSWLLDHGSSSISRKESRDEHERSI